MIGWPTIVQAIGGTPLPKPAGPVPARYITSATPEDLNPAEVDARELARLLGVSRQRADQRLQRARLSGDYTLLVNAINRAINAGATPATFTTCAGAAAGSATSSAHKETT